MLPLLSKNEKQALAEFKFNLFHELGHNLKTIQLFGSKARGDSHAESDLDVLVLVGESDFRLREKISDIAYDILLKYEILISPRVIDEKKYAQLNRWNTGFIRNIKRDGVPL